MADIHSLKVRSYNMSRVRSENTKPELIVRKYLHSRGFRYRINDKRYPGKPDIVIPKYKTIVFVNGCFWHGHDCKAGKLPDTKTEFWKQKIKDNIKRDKRNKDKLLSLGWNVIVVWQCHLKNKERKENRLKHLIGEILN